MFLGLEGFKKFIFNFLNFCIPSQYSLVQENNINGKFDEKFVLTHKGNLVGAISLSGITYSNFDKEGVATQFLYRTQALNELIDGVTLRIVAKRRDIKTQTIYNKDGVSKYAKKIVNAYEKNKEFYITTYYLIIETKSVNIKGLLEKWKAKMTTDKYVNNDEEKPLKDNLKNSEVQKQEAYKIKKNVLENKELQDKATLLAEILNKMSSILTDFEPKFLSSDDLLNLYAEYCNGHYCDFKYKQGRLSDGNIQSHLYFKKDHFIHDYNGIETFKRFIAVKAYDVDNITSLALSNLLCEKFNLDILLTIEAMDKERALFFIRERKKRSKNISYQNIEYLEQMVSTDRAQIQKVSLSIMVFANSKKELDKKSIIVYNTLKREGFSAVLESINMRPIFFSFFPERNFLNSRLRPQTSQNIASLIMFEKYQEGFKENSWGDCPISVFKNQNGSAHFFNFQAKQGRDRNDNVVGHTMIIGSTGSGKSTFISFLIANLLTKYDMSVVALDRMNGLEIMTDFFEGQYNTANTDGGFYINPFSLKDTEENRQFLANWIKFMLNIDSDNQQDNKASQSIDKVIRDTYNYMGEQKNQINLLEIAKNLGSSEQDFNEILKSQGEKVYFKKFQDCLDFSKSPLSVINMDAFANDKKLMGLIAMYLFHKLFFEAKEHNKPFFLFIDETKDYIMHPIMFAYIANALAQARKINGTLCMAFQKISQVKELGIDKAKSLIGNLSQVIIYPTKDTDELIECGVPLSDSEINFLHNTDMRARQVLVKNIVTNASAFIEIDLKKDLQELLYILDSNAGNRKILNDLKKTNQETYKEEYLKTKMKKESENVQYV
ncbi:type IV secretion system DNA-binding domain-containing protein [Helicobacter pylori]